MIFRKGNLERPVIRWTANICLALGVLAALGMFDMFVKNGGESGWFALWMLAVSVAYWLALRHWANRPGIKPKPNPRRVRTHRARMNMASHR
jgi:hypothetical protein